MSEQVMASPLIAKYCRVIDKNPKSRVFAPLAESYRQLGMLDKAIDVLKNGIRYNPDYALGYLGMASCYYDMKKNSLAYATLRPIVETNRDNLRLQRLFAVICEESGHIEEALETYKYLLFINPRDKEVAKKVAVIEKTMDVEAIHKPTQEYSSATESEVRLFDTESLNSTELEDVDNWTKVDFTQNSAKQEAEMVIKELPKVKAQTIELADIEEEVGVEEEIDVTTEVPVVTHTLVDIYCSQGYFKKAKEVLLKISELNPEDEKTRNKIKEVEAKMGDSVENHGHDQLMSIIDEKFGTREEERLDHLQSKYDKFMKQLKKRASQSLE